MVSYLLSYNHPDKYTTKLEVLRIGNFVMLEIIADKRKKNNSITLGF